MARIEEQHIFIVDDDPAICAAIRETLENSGLKTSSFTRASDCLEQLGSQRCDLLIADLKMPEMDGIELLRRARALVPQLPVLVVTGYGTVPSAVQAMRSGAADFIEKPLVKEDFLREVRALLRENSFAGKNYNLTRTEAKVLKMVLAGRSNKEIATLLKRSPRTVETHRAHLMEKLGAENLVELTKRAAIMGLLDLAADPQPYEGPRAPEPG